MANEQFDGSLSGVEPMLAVENVVHTVRYWHDILGFADKWTWGEPPNHGGVSWHGTAVQFSLNPELATASKGNSIFFRVKNLEAMYRFHQNKNAEIVAPLENKPWGLASYMVRELNGYYLIFAGAPLSDRKPKSELTKASVKIIERGPTIKEYQELTSSVGWSAYSEDKVIEKLLQAPVYAVVAEDPSKGEVIGCALLLTDHVSFYYVKDVIVHPEWQHKGVGTLLLRNLNHWLDKNAADKALVALISGEGLAPFYQQFDFSPAFCMVKYIQRVQFDY